ncbi:MAG: flagellar export protein FliJ [Oscillospiraceae bacterium]|nr:flagellar export protein FliJ [Oscillospiraceae bacterium]
MKKFKFPLDTVLAYKKNILDTLQIEHGRILAEIRRQLELIEQMQQDYEAFSSEFRTRSAEGLGIRDAQNYQLEIRARERDIEKEEIRLQALRKQEEAKRAEIVEVKTDTSAIEKLREKKLAAYNAAAAKAEEIAVEEFVSSRMSVQSTDE